MRYKSATSLLTTLGPSILTGLAVIVGGYIRLAPALSANFPVVDGGLFYTMGEDLRANGYLIPAFTSYNDANIPFAYPSLSFYFFELLSQATGISVLDIMRLLPPLISTLTILALYLLANKILGSSWLAAVASAAFAFLPNAFILQMLGGGITRATGYLFSILCLYSWYLWLEHRRVRYALLSTLFLVIAAWTHPTGLLLTMPPILLLCLAYGRTRRTFAEAAALLAVTVAALSPWWLTVMSYHGASTFVNSLGTSGTPNPLRLFLLIGFNFTGEEGVSALAVLSLLGSLLALAERRWLLLAWFLTLIIFFPRSGDQYAMVPMAMLCALAVGKVFGYILNHKGVPRTWGRIVVATGAVWLFLHSAGTAYLSAPTTQVQDSLLNNDDITAFRWVREHIKPGAYFALARGNLTWYDPIAEWFYPFTRSVNATGFQGREWKSPAEFDRWRDRTITLQNCNFAPTCLEEWISEPGWRTDYLYLRKPPEAQAGNLSCCPTLKSAVNQIRYKLLYDGPGAYIYELPHQ